MLFFVGSLSVPSPRNISMRLQPGGKGQDTCPGTTCSAPRVHHRMLKKQVQHQFLDTCSRVARAQAKTDTKISHREAKHRESRIQRLKKCFMSCLQNVPQQNMMVSKSFHSQWEIILSICKSGPKPFLGRLQGLHTYIQRVDTQCNKTIKKCGLVKILKRIQSSEMYSL